MDEHPARGTGAQVVMVGHCGGARVAPLMVTDLETGTAGERGSSSKAEKTQQAVWEDRAGPGGLQQTWVPGSFSPVFVLKKILILLLKYFLTVRDCNLGS